MFVFLHIGKNHTKLSNDFSRTPSPFPALSSKAVSLYRRVLLVQRLRNPLRNEANLGRHTLKRFTDNNNLNTFQTTIFVL